MPSSAPVFCTLVGSRETEDDPYITALQELAGELFCCLGYRGRSGLAPGSDRNFYVGAQRSNRFDEIGFDNYLPNDWFFNRAKFGFIRPDPERNIFNAKLFTETYDMARQMAFDARGSWEGLYPDGIELHTRNAFQVYGHDLAVPSRFCMFWAIPVGRKGKVRGGTNTAVQLALKCGMPTLNLFHPPIRARLLISLQKHRTLLCEQSQRKLDELLQDNPDAAEQTAPQTQ